MGPEPTLAKRPRRWPRVLFGTALLAVVIWLVGPAALASTFTRMRPAYVLAAFLVNAAAVGLRVIRWRRLAALQNLALSPREALRGYGLGMLLAMVTPGRVGQHAKAVMLVRRGASWDRALANTVVDQLLDAAVGVALLPVGLAHFGMALGGSPLWTAGLVLVAVAGLGALAVASGRGRQAVAEARALGGRSFGWPVALTILSAAAYLGSVGLVGRAVGMEIGYLALALATVVAAVVDVLPVTVAGIGTREVSLIALLGPLGVSGAAIVALTLGLRGLHVAIGGLAYALGTGEAPGAGGAADPVQPTMS